MQLQDYIVTYPGLGCSKYGFSPFFAWSSDPDQSLTIHNTEYDWYKEAGPAERQSTWL